MRPPLAYLGLAFLPILVVASLAVPLSVLATSGACSYHGGVDCAAGPGIYGQVICNDGWTDSSVSYDSMVECEGYDNSYTPNVYQPVVPTIPSCPAESYYDSISGSCQCFAGYAAQGDICVNLDEQCRNQLGLMSNYNTLDNTCQCMAGYVISGGQCVSEDTYCQNTFGDYAESNYAGGCKCQYGYVLNAVQDECISGDTYCQDTFGDYATYDSLSNSCGCQDGYQMTDGQCQEIPVVSDQPAPVTLENYPTISSPPPLAPAPAPKKKYIIIRNAPEATTTPSSSLQENASSSVSSSIVIATSSDVTSTPAAPTISPQTATQVSNDGFFSKIWNFFSRFF